MEGTVHFRDLDEGYEQCRSVYDTVKEKGDNLLRELEELYSKLDNHWKGEDATQHINQIAEVHNGINKFVNETGDAIVSTTSDVVKVQEVRTANGANGYVGSQLASIPARSTLSPISGTKEYSCEPEAKNDLELLNQICEEFAEFASRVEEKFNTLFDNWMAGSKRENAVNSFNTFMSDTSKYKTQLEETRHDLETAVANLSEIM